MARPRGAADAFRSSRRSASRSATARRSRCTTRSLRVMPGESHALVGRNGAGKSTLVGILTGLREPDSGEVRFRGEPAPAIADREAWRRRVACVYQHSTIIPDLTVAENLFINRQPLRRGFINWNTLWREAREVLDRWNVVGLRGRSRAGDLKVEARQLVEIARALSYGARFIILDEPTAQLDGEEIKRLFARMRELQAQGVTFLFISHHLQEVYEVCQTVTVLRDARHIVTAPVADLAQGRADRGDDRRAGEFQLRRRRQPDSARPRRRSRSKSNGLGGERFRGRELLRPRAARSSDFSGATSSGRLGVAEAVAGLGAVRRRRDPHQRRAAAARATSPRRSRSASAACRKAGTGRASFCRNRSPTTPR